jgi:IclR family transcriptional regulator, pca regulon regulatory protein
MMPTLGEDEIVSPDAPVREAPDREIMGGFLKGLSVIEAFSRDREALTIAEVAKATGLDRATARRCLLSLQRVGYAETDGRYFRLTPRILRLGFAYLAATPLPRLVQPYLDRLSESTRESCSAAVLDDTEIVYVARASQRRVLSVALTVGSRLPAYCTSMGRVLLASLPEAERRSILDRSERRRLTRHTVTDLESLMEILRRVAADDFATVDEELEIGLRSIAAPIRNSSGHVMAAFNVGAQAARVSLSQMVTDFLPAMRQAQPDVSRLLSSPEPRTLGMAASGKRQ